MARIDKALFSRLSANATLSALVGARIYPLRLPQNPDLPAVTYQQISGVRESALSEDVGLAHGTFQFDTWALEWTDAREVADAVLGALKRADFTAADVPVLDAILESERALYEEEARVYRVSLDLVVWWRE